jgi:Fic family protein
MSCNFHVKNCLNCLKYNGCLLQVIYANTLSITEILLDISKNQKVLSNDIEQLKLNNDVSMTDSLDLSLELDNISSNIDKIKNLLSTKDENNDETIIDITQIKNSLSLIDLKIDDLVQKYNDYEYVSDERINNV